MLREQVYSRPVQVAQKAAFHPFPRLEDRDCWDLADSRIREYVLQKAEPYLNFCWPMILATDYMECFRSGNRAQQETPYFARRDALSILVLAECFENRGRFLNQIINGIWCICEETSWVVSAHNFIYELDPANQSRTLPDVDMQMLDLFAGETAMLLSMTEYLLGRRLDEIEPLVSRRIRRELKKRIIDPFLNRYDYWWMGYSERRDINNWGPWCVANCLTCLLLQEPEDDRRNRGVVRAMDMLDRYLEGISEDGGCDEGATYWGRACGMLLEALFLTDNATGGNIQVYSDAKLRNFADYLRKMYIAGDYVVNFADGAARVNPPAEIIYMAGCKMNSPYLAGFGAYLYSYQMDHGIFPATSIVRAVRTIERSQEMLFWKESPYFETSLYLESQQILAARQKSDPEKGFFLCAKGGWNQDSHNHNDIGQVVLYYNGTPILIDVGVEVYRKYFFGKDRYRIWTMQSDYHNLPSFNGVMQHDGPNFRAKNVAYSIGGKICRIEMELAEAYPSEAKLKSLRREVVFSRDQWEVRLTDQFQMENPGMVEFHFMTSREPSLFSQGILLNRNSDAVWMRFETDGWEISAERILLDDAKLTASWGKQIFRILVKSISPVSCGELTISFLPYQDADLSEKKELLIREIPEQSLQINKTIERNESL